MLNKSRWSQVLITTMLLMVLMLASNQVSAQKKEVVNGKTYYVHIVQKGHTLYGISKQYAVDINLLYENNPSVKDGLTIGERVLIPFSKVKPKEFKKAPKYKANGLMHKVAKKETLYSISKKYNIDINELIARNPGAESGIVKGDVLIIPIEKTEGQEQLVLEPAKELAANQHLVGKSETLYGIAKENGVTLEELSEANNGFPDGLKVGEVIRIPVGTTPTDELGNIPEPKDSLIILTGEPLEEINVGLLLPFSFSLVDTNSIPNSGGNSYRMTDIAMEFYRGVRMSLEEKEGMKINLFVYDVTKEEAAIKKFLAKKEVDQLDVVIGPLHGSSFGRISKALRGRGIHLVSPLTKSIEVIDHKPACSKVQPSNESHMRFLAKKTWDRFNTSQLIVIDSELPKDKELLDTFLTSFAKISGGKKPAVVKLSKYNQNSIKEAMMKGLPNLVVIPSANKPFVSDMFTRLNDAILKDFDIEIYGIEPWLKYDNISADQKNKWKLRLSSSKYLDYEGKATTKFIKAYYKKYGTMPVSDGYGLLAYDIANFYLDGIYNYGKVFLDHPDQERVDGLFTGFDFHQIPGGGWENDYKYILRYEDYNLIKE